MLPFLLRPPAACVEWLTARRVSRPGWRAPVPVICCGNVSVGGAGKTPLALDLLRKLNARGVRAHALLRGYGGSASATRRVEPDDDPILVGDEALLLAALAPTWIGADRAASARVAVAAGAEALVLDDGLQNPTLCKDVSFLVIDGGFGFGNGHVLPAGPLREPVAAAAARCRAAVLIGADETGALKQLPSDLPVLRARLIPGPEAGTLAGVRVLAFAGIGRPEKFFRTVRDTGALVVGQRPFPDHYRFTPRDLERITADAHALDATAVTTAKDAVRLPPTMRVGIRVLTVSLAWDDDAPIEALLTEILTEVHRRSG